MIFATVGTQLPFPRLVSALDLLRPRLGRRIVAQIGSNPDVPKNLECYEFIQPYQFEVFFQAAEIIVAHAGIGTVLAAQKYRKPIILMPRRAALGEHRNDHQVATVRQLHGYPGIYVASDQDELAELLLHTELRCAERGDSRSLTGLQTAVKRFMLAKNSSDNSCL